MSNDAPDRALLRRPGGAAVRVLMVCLGNICRSPTAQGVLEKLAAEAGLADRIQVDSAGTGDWHVGRPPDERAQEHALRRGVDLSAQRARQLTPRDFVRFDLVLVMDAANERAARTLCPPEHAHKLRRLTGGRSGQLPFSWAGVRASLISSLLQSSNQENRMRRVGGRSG